MILRILIVLFAVVQVHATPTLEQPDRNIEYYNLDNGVGLHGYDPVAYFEEFGGEALEGNPSISATYGGVTYYFVNRFHRSIFLEDPLRFEPVGGGWNPFALANNAFADIDPTRFYQKGRRMFFFISQGSQVRFIRDPRLEQWADEFWEKETGEKPRL
ncbi:MAG: hypothetical protein AAF203_09710 [Pseudomonadota bacterium]